MIVQYNSAIRKQESRSEKSTADTNCEFENGCKLIVFALQFYIDLSGQKIGFRFGLRRGRFDGIRFYGSDSFRIDCSKFSETWELHSTLEQKRTLFIWPKFFGEDYFIDRVTDYEPMAIDRLNEYEDQLKAELHYHEIDFFQIQ